MRHIDFKSGLRAFLIVLLFWWAISHAQAQILSSISFGGALPTDGTPTFSPGAGTYSSTQSVTISTVTSGATLCYTTDGSTPTATVPGTCDGNTYSTPLSVSTSQTIKAIATKLLTVNSAVGSAAYVISSLGTTTNNIPFAEAGSQSQPSFTLGSTPSVGQSICYFISYPSSKTVNSITDNQSPANTYTVLGTSGTLNSNTLISYACGYIATASGTFTVTTTLSTTFQIVSGMAFTLTGLPSSGATFDGSNAAYASFTGACASGNFTNSNAVDLILGYAQFTGSTIPTVGTNNGGYTIPTNGSSATTKTAGEYRISSSSITTNNPNWTLASANIYCAGFGVH